MNPSPLSENDILPRWESGKNKRLLDVEILREKLLALDSILSKRQESIGTRFTYEIGMEDAKQCIKEMFAVILVEQQSTEDKK